MPRYLFHIENGQRISSDEETLPNPEAARRVAEQIARDLSRNRLSRIILRLVLTDDTGAMLADIPIVGKIK